MKKLLIFLFFIGIFLITPAVCVAEDIDNYQVSLQINQDASLNVEENIVYNFGTELRHGIFRQIPIKYQARGGNYNLRISDIYVTDENNLPYKFDISYPQNYIQIKIGDANAYVTGLKTYIISYKIKRAINYFDNYDELFWNVTGNEWPAPIKQARAIVSLPEGIEQQNLQTACYAGPYGSTQTCDKITYAYNNKNLVEDVTFNQEDLDYNEGLSIVIGLPKGLIYQPTILESLLAIARDNWIVFLPILVFIILFYLWYTRGKDPAGRGTIIAEFDPPDKLSPAQVGTIYDEKAQHKDISAEIIYLAIKGYLKITREETGKIFKLHDYTFDKLKGADDNLNSFQKTLMADLFDSGDKVKLSELINNFYKDLATITKEVYQSTVTAKYFLKSPQAVRGAYLGFGLVVLFLLFFIGPLMGFIGWLSLLISAGLIMLFSLVMPKKTRKGVLAKEHILGLKLYLTVAEKERIKFHNAPEKNPHEFERLLPYAMVLGVENQWAKQFADIYKDQSPSWYNDPSTANFSSFALVSSLNNFSTQANSNLSSHPSSAASGSSGFSSGGGFSGGGFGGGGGGSW